MKNIHKITFLNSIKMLVWFKKNDFCTVVKHLLVFNFIEVMSDCVHCIHLNEYNIYVGDFVSSTIKQRIFNGKTMINLETICR
jgi:hypothetical protein